MRFPVLFFVLGHPGSGAGEGDHLCPRPCVALPAGFSFLRYKLKTGQRKKFFSEVIKKLKINIDISKKIVYNTIITLIKGLRKETEIQ